MIGIYLIIISICIVVVLYRLALYYFVKKSKYRPSKYLVFGITIILFFSIMGIRTASNNTRKEVKSIDRADYKEGSKKIDLIASLEEDEYSISIEVPERKYTMDEALNYVEKYYDSFLKLVLAGNSDFNNINQRLNLLTKVDNTNIEVIWDLSKALCIDFSGDIKKDIINSYKDYPVEENISACFCYGGYEFVKNYKLYIYKQELSIAEQIEMYIKDYFISMDNQYSDKLPEEVIVDDTYKTASFYEINNSNEEIFILLIAIGLVMVRLLYINDKKKLIKTQISQLERDYPELVYKISMLYQAGMSIKAAWLHTINTINKKGVLYQYMIFAKQQMECGVSEKKALETFSVHCGLHIYNRFVSILEQNIDKGTKNMIQLLESEVRYADNERLNNARRRGEEATTKLLGPMIMILIVIIVVIIVPAFMGI